MNERFFIKKEEIKIIKKKQPKITKDSLFEKVKKLFKKK